VTDDSERRFTDRLLLQRNSPGHFRSALPTGRGHVFGGLLVAQALRAAALTLRTPAPARSLHASFLLPGRGGEHLEHTVERTRDGRSFATRRVTVEQSHGTVLVLTADFHVEEDGAEYAIDGPVVPHPDTLAPGRYDTVFLDSRDVPAESVTSAPPFARHAWFRLREPLPDHDIALHQAALSYFSDSGPTRAAREPHAHLADDARRQSVTLDHSIWFHRPASANEWVLSQLYPVSTARGRGLALGSFRTLDGLLVATIAQEVLLRTRTPRPE
jgi:acyl-CoA thioesterase II